MTQDPRYPIGKFEAMPFSEATKKSWINEIRVAPRNLELTVQHLDKAQLDTPYREGGWTVHQLIHHMADSHMNAFIRFKLALTEEVPPIKTYDEKAWVNTADALLTPINYSTTILHALHERWANLLESMTDEQWQRKLFHPVRNAEVSLWDMLSIYSWHGKHHIAHIKNLLDQKGW
jgi:uncharacterized damage-inducible protein DinB